MQQDWGTKSQDVDLGLLTVEGSSSQLLNWTQKMSSVILNSKDENKGVCEWTMVKDGVEGCSDFLEQALGFQPWLYELEGSWLVGRLASVKTM